MTQWLAALAALPKILEFGLKLLNYIQDRFGPDWVSKLGEIHEATLKLEGATTDAERLKALRSLINASRVK